MSTIYLDPVAMDATAGAIGEHAREVEDIVATLESACSASVPVHLASWLAEELHDIAVQAQMVALLYCVAALDTALRAQQIQADQSLVAAQPNLVASSVGTEGLYPTTMTIGGPSPYGMVSGMPAGPTTMTIGGPSPYGVVSGMPAGPSTMTIGGTPTYAHDPFLALASQVQHSNPAFAAQLLGVSSGLSESNAEMGRAWTNSRPGASYVGDGLYRGLDGRTGPITSVYRNPNRPGEYEVS
jgi:hypothetical protein